MKTLAMALFVLLSLGACSEGETEAAAPDPAVRQAHCDREVKELCADLTGNEMFQCVQREARRCLTEAAES